MKDVGAQLSIYIEGVQYLLAIEPEGWRFTKLGSKSSRFVEPRGGSFTCDCPAFGRYGKCRHILGLHDVKLIRTPATTNEVIA